MAGSTDPSVARPNPAERPPARIHVLLARTAPVGLVWRRGPSKHVCAIGWNRLNDTFVVGQWLKGRIYERRSDLSPDGQHLIYFALKGKPGANISTCHTYVSRAPYLKPVGQWDRADNRYGGGLFTNATTFWINDERGHRPFRMPRGLRSVPHYRDENVFGCDCAGLYFLRLQQDGWTLTNRQEVLTGKGIGIFERSAGEGWLLRRLAHAVTANAADTHELLHAASGKVLSFPDWEWADMDRTRLVYSTAGKLFTVPLTPDGPGESKQLFDFNPLAFVAREAPY